MGMGFGSLGVDFRLLNSSEKGGLRSVGTWVSSRKLSVH